MIQDLDKFEELPPERARYVLAETKLKLMNLMSHLEFLESRLAHREGSGTGTRPTIHPNPTIPPKSGAVSSTSPAQQ